MFVGHSVSGSIGLLASIARPELFERLVLIGPSPCFLNDPPDYAGGFEREDMEGLLSLMEQNYIGWANYLAPVMSSAPSESPLTGELSESFCSTDPVIAKNFCAGHLFLRQQGGLGARFTAVFNFATPNRCPGPPGLATICTNT
jgi:sigma-B regulation protein RsbQ